MVLTSRSPVTQLRNCYLVAGMIFLLSWVYWPAASLWLVFIAWICFCRHKASTALLQHVYWNILQSIGLYIGLHLAAIGAILNAGRFKYGGLFSATGAENFVYLLSFGLLGALLWITGNIWPIIRLVKGHRRFTSALKQEKGSVANFESLG
ncbi:hypothetical protein CWO33_07995 [Vibrio splendidus]|uniref:hypothetical protein n=1 Tax=Vibrio splendidus TaxID=29497 RepID=UPI000D38A6D2|nr:hypothetical protein [Vibrio splendidus]PTQ15945.1 hypothetical protein CWO33_07995 [Vibrio splendidus]